MIMGMQPITLILIAIIVIVVLIVLSGIKVIQQSETKIVERLGKPPALTVGMPSFTVILSRSRTLQHSWKEPAM